MSAAGKVVTGFSKPYVAKYAYTGGAFSYSSGQILARGVSVSASVDASDDNKFYADNIVAETESGVFTSGELTLTVDGLLEAAEKLIMGLPTADAAGFINWDDTQNIPDVGIGFVVRYMSDGVTTYAPIIFPRCAFKFTGIDAATQEENISWQTRELTATVKRAEDTGRTWRKLGEEKSSEALAENMIRTFFSISPALST